MTLLNVIFQVSNAKESLFTIFTRMFFRNFMNIFVVSFHCLDTKPETFDNFAQIRVLHRVLPKALLRKMLHGVLHNQECCNVAHSVVVSKCCTI